MTGIDEKAKEYVGGSDYADSVFGKSERHAYVSGAEYVIDKACKWLEKNLWAEITEDAIVFLRTNREDCMDNFIDHFRKAMEE